MKVCSKCNMPKPHFHKNAASADGLSPYCSDCASAISNQWQAEHPERKRQIQNAAFARNSTDILDRRKARRRKRREQSS